MAASIMSCRGLSKTLGFVQTTLFSRTEQSRILTQLQITRGERRTSKPPPWYAKKRVPKYFYNLELTAENKDFLQEVVHDRFTPQNVNSPLKDAPFKRNEFTAKTMRTGVLAIKLGIVPQWTKDGRRFTTTMLQVLDNHVVRYTPPEVYTKSYGYRKRWKPNTYGSLVVGALSCDPLMYSKQYNNLFAEAGLPPKRKLTRFLITPDAAIEPGTPLHATHFKVGDYVDCQAKTIGHGFQGVVKRWKMKGGPASHGATKWHRRVGNIGGGRDTAKVWKGKKMPGHMGMAWRYLRGLKIYRINTKYNVLYVLGQNIPGPTHCYVRIMDTKLPLRRRKMLENPPYMPTFCSEDDDEPLPEEIFDETLYQFSESTIIFQEEKGKS